MTRLSPILSVMSDAAQKAAPSLRRDFGEIEHLQSAEAGAQDYAAKAAARITKQLYGELAPARADYGFVFRTGETVAGPDKTHRWLIDPLAGQVNFSNGIPHFGVAITLERTQDGITAPVASLIYNPITDELFHSDNGNSAFCNSTRLRVSRKQSLAGALIACAHAPLIPILEAQGAHIRVFGGDTLDYAQLCAGKYDGIIAHAPPLWEKASATIFAQESGGLITQIDDIFIMGGEAICAVLKDHI